MYTYFAIHFIIQYSTEKSIKFGYYLSYLWFVNQRNTYVPGQEKGRIGLSLDVLRFGLLGYNHRSRQFYP